MRLAMTQHPPYPAFPAQAGIQTLTLWRVAARQTPAFAVSAADGEWMNTPSPNPLPQGGEGFVLLSPLPEGEGWVRDLLFYPPNFPP